MSLANWKNPTKLLNATPLNQRWAEIVQIMDTHLNGVCPLHIYENRRPLESLETYAIDYRASNFEPLTMSAFKTAISSITEICQQSNIKILKNKILDNLILKIDNIDIEEFINGKLVTERENDPNAIILILPKFSSIQDTEFKTLNGISLVFVKSKDIVYVNGNNIKIKLKKEDVFLLVEDGNYILKSKNKEGEEVTENLIFIKSDFKPYIKISSNEVTEGNYKLNLPYLYGSAAWGNKFYGQESDFSISATRYTYIKEIRAKEPCNEPGTTMIEGKHCYGDVNNVCKSCHGLGYVKDDSPLSTIYVDYDKISSENGTIPNFITYTEPPQGAITHSEQITKGYWDAMCDSLGLIKQNMTNQSGLSKSFDWMQKIKLINMILVDNLRVLKEVYMACEVVLNPSIEPTSDVKLIGEVADNSLTGLLERLEIAKKNQSPMGVIYELIENIYLKSNTSIYAPKAISIAKNYDILFGYGSDELIKAKAQLGSAIGLREVIIHNTIIGVLVDYFEINLDATNESAITYLDNYYLKYANQTPSFL